MPLLRRSLLSRLRGIIGRRLPDARSSQDGDSYSTVTHSISSATPSSQSNRSLSRPSSCPSRGKLTLREAANLWPQSIDALAEALEAFPGGVIIISHDAQLLSRVCDETSEVSRKAS